MIRLSLLLALCLGSFLSASLSAQTYTPHTLVFNGSSDDFKDLAAVALIAVDKPLATTEIEAAMGRLADTGLFSDIQYTVNAQALTFTLTPQPAARMLPVVYGNFILWKPEQLTALVHARVPLFTGTVPTTGSFGQTVADALTAILLDDPSLKAQNVHAAASGMLADVNGKKSFVYTISDPPVLIRQIRVEPVSTIPTSRIYQVVQSFNLSEYDRGAPDAIRQRLLETYLDLGFLDAAIDTPARGTPIVAPSRILVDYTVTAHENGQYHIAAMEWPATPIVSKADFDRAISLKAGDPASRIEVLSATKHAEAEYSRRGYLDAHVTLHERKDQSTHTIAYTGSVDPGEMYHLKSVRTVGFTDQQQRDFDKYWTLKPGDVFDGSVVGSFLVRNANVVSFQGFGASYQVNRDKTDHTVELVVSLVKRGPRT